MTYSLQPKTPLMSNFRDYVDSYNCTKPLINKIIPNYSIYDYLPKDCIQINEEKINKSEFTDMLSTTLQYIKDIRSRLITLELNSLKPETKYLSINSTDKFFCDSNFQSNLNNLRFKTSHSCCHCQYKKRRNSDYIDIKSNKKSVRKKIIEDVQSSPQRTYNNTAMQTSIQLFESSRTYGSLISMKE